MEKMENYTTTRNSIYTGKLIRIKNENVNIWDSCSFESRKKVIAEQNIDKINPYEIFLCRAMLFNINEEGLANDLIYTNTDNYQIEGIKPKVEADNEYVIYKHFALEEILRYLNFGTNLTQDDLLKIFKILRSFRKWQDCLKMQIISGIHLPDFSKWRNVIFVKAGKDIRYRSDGKLEIPYNIAEILEYFYTNSKPNQCEPNYSLIKKGVII